MSTFDRDATKKALEWWENSLSLPEISRQRYKQLGNAVAVPVVEWILGNIAKAAP